MFVLLCLAGICFLIAVFTLTADTDADTDHWAGTRNVLVAIIWGCVAGGLALLAGVIAAIRFLRGSTDGDAEEDG